MDTYREHPSDFELPSDDASAPYDVAAAIGTDERRMHVRAYNHWVSLLEGRDFPSIEDLEPADVSDFATHSVLLDFTCGRDNPAIPYVGTAIRDECGVDDDMRVIADVPSRSLMSRLTDHYMQIIANRAPVGFEAEFENQRSESICYRGILMPFSSDGDTIDFIYGVINWKHVGEGAHDASEEFEMPVVEFAEPEPETGSEDGEPGAVSAPEPESIDEEPLELTDLAGEEDALELTQVLEVPTIPDAFAPASEEAADVAEPEFGATPPVHFSWEDSPLGDEDEVPVVELDENAGLADRLWAARETAESVKAGEGRTRAALYKALSLAYDFALAAQQNSEEYA